MEFYEYFQSYDKYFWQWEDVTEVIAIPDESTIAYRDFVIEILEKLAPQGIPPLGSLLLAIIATNHKGNKSIETVHAIVSNALNTSNEILLTEAISFLKLLNELPQQYKEGKNRLLLFQVIFERCHNMVSVKKSKKIIADYIANRYKPEKIISKKEFSKANFNKDFKVLSLLKNKFQDINDIIEKVASLPEIPDEEFILENNKIEESVSEDLIEQLTQNNKTFYVGSLIKRIWSGLNIPVHTALPSQQPLGGVADLTNKGDFDKLLISEFANDDLVFLSRLANNEALYIRREVPPSNNNLQRVILIDVSLKNWGTPKTIAYAIMLAIAKHPKTDIKCTAFAIGDSYHPISIDNIETIIDGLKQLGSTLHAANGLAKFFKEHPANKNREVFVITEPSTLNQADMLKASNEYHSFIDYWIHTNAEGNIDIYKKQQNSKKHIQHIQLPLAELWKKEINEVNEISKRRNESNIYYPILFRNSMNNKKLMSTSEGEIFQITGEKTVLRFYDKQAKLYERGWEIMYEHLPFVVGEFEIGLVDNGDYILLMFSLQNREATLLNMTTKEKISVLFNEWRSTAFNSFVYHEQKFYHMNSKGCWSISVNGKVEKNSSTDRTIFSEREKELKAISQKYSYAQAVLKNINEIYINEVNNLVFNTHELHLNPGQHIKLDKAVFNVKQVVAVKLNDREFEFTDGSRVEINRGGMLILKSSNNSIPYIYIPSMLDVSLGVATENAFAGNVYYYKEPQYTVILKDPGTNKIGIIKLIKGFVEIGLSGAQTIVANAPKNMVHFCPKSKADKIKETLEANGAMVEIIPSFLQEEQLEEQEKINTSSFFTKYINAFVSNIQAYGVKN